MIKNRKKYIITGAPGTGKTTLVSRLKEKADCIEEVSRRVIVSEQQAKGDGTPWGDVERFVDLVYEGFLKELKEKPQSLFCDRSILDLIAYLKVNNKPIPKKLNDFTYQETFHKTVFFAPTWRAIYRKDAQRPQDFELCLQLEEKLLEVYNEKGFRIVKLPKSLVDQRLLLIKKSVNLNQVFDVQCT